MAISISRCSGTTRRWIPPGRWDTLRTAAIVYDCMDELSQFTGAPPTLLQQEARLIRHADVVFAGGYELGEKKRKQHHNVHTFGCGVEYRALLPGQRSPHARPAGHRLHAASDPRMVRRGR